SSAASAPPTERPAAALPEREAPHQRPPGVVVHLLGRSSPASVAPPRMPTPSCAALKRRRDGPNHTICPHLYHQRARCGVPMASGEVPAHPGPAPATDARPPAELRRGVVGFGGVLFQSITFMAPAIATAFSIPIGMAFGGGATVLAVILALIASLFVASSI